VTASAYRGPAGPSIRDARRQIYRQRILIAAEFEFARVGFNAAKVNAIAAVADVSLATLYKNFKGKDDIWDVLQSQRMNELVSSVQTATADISSPWERLIRGCRAEVAFFVANPNFLTLHMKEGFNWATAVKVVHAGRGNQRTNWRAGNEMLIRGVDAAIAAGELKPQKPTIVAGLMISALQVWLNDWVASGRERPGEQVADELVAYLKVALPRLNVPPAHPVPAGRPRKKPRRLA
jgi:AcrR family transcriptional regulator